MVVQDYMHKELLDVFKGQELSVRNVQYYKDVFNEIQKAITSFKLTVF